MRSAPRRTFISLPTSVIISASIHRFVCRFITRVTVVAACLAFAGAQPQGFVAKAQPATAASAEATSVVAAASVAAKDTSDLNEAAANYRPQQQSYEYAEEEDEEEAAKQQPQQYQQQPQIGRRQQQQQQYVRKGQTKQELLDELEEQEEPDRLTQLLEQSDFKCDGRTG